MEFYQAGIILIKLHIVYLQQIKILKNCLKLLLKMLVKNEMFNTN